MFALNFYFIFVQHRNLGLQSGYKCINLKYQTIQALLNSLYILVIICGKDIIYITYHWDLLKLI